MLHKSRHAIEKILRNRGFAPPESRRIMANQILLTLVALAAGALAWPLTLWPASFALGTALASANLWWMAKSIRWSLSQRFSPALALAYFGGFLFRYAGTGALIYLLLVTLSLPIVPLVAGLSSVVVCLTIIGLSRTAGNSCKEA